LRERVAYKFHSALDGERCSVLAARLFKATGTAGIAAEHPFGRMLADISVGRQHISNQFEQAGRSFGATLFGIENNKDFVL
jgi:3-hydroxy-9,10-secoandrosta-1,3,5(10)-triene-9,17-dione monooxygenase